MVVFPKALMYTRILEVRSWHFVLSYNEADKSYKFCGFDRTRAPRAAPLTSILGSSAAILGQCGQSRWAQRIHCIAGLKMKSCCQSCL
jgi:hypothetical protein